MTDTISCEHGALKRSCQFCEYESEIAALLADKRRLSDTVAAQVAEMAALRAEVERLREDRQEAVKIIMAVVGNGLLKEAVECLPAWGGEG